MRPSLRLQSALQIQNAVLAGLSMPALGADKMLLPEAEEAHFSCGKLPDFPGLGLTEHIQEKYLKQFLS